MRRPMEEEARIGPAEVQRAVEAVQEHAERRALAALAFDVLSRQAEGRVLFAGREYVEARAEEHGVEREAAACDGTNLLSILERGPATARERALVAAFAVSGLGDRLAEAGEAERRSLVERLVRHADWLETATPFVVYAFVEPLLEREVAETVWSAVADAVLAAGQGSAAARARNAARLGALAEAGESAEQARSRVRQQAEEPVVRALAGVLLGAEGAASEPPPARGAPNGGTVELEGRLGYAVRPSVGHVLRWVTGVALVQWLLRGLAFVVGLRRDVELELGGDAVRVRRRTHLLGRLVREARETYTLKAVAGAERLSRYPAVHLLVGAVAMAAGVLFGGLLVFDALWSGETVLLLVAAALVLAGGGLDLALQVYVPAHRETVAFELRVLPKRTLRLVRVPRADADRFLDALAARI